VRRLDFCVLIEADETSGRTGKPKNKLNTKSTRNTRKKRERERERGKAEESGLNVRVGWRARAVDFRTTAGSSSEGCSLTFGLFLDSVTTAFPSLPLSSLHSLFGFCSFGPSNSCLAFVTNHGRPEKPRSFSPRRSSDAVYLCPKSIGENIGPRKEANEPRFEAKEVNLKCS
jgi:hypothetical protein